MATGAAITHTFPSALKKCQHTTWIKLLACKDPPCISLALPSDDNAQRNPGESLCHLSSQPSTTLMEQRFPKLPENTAEMKTVLEVGWGQGYLEIPLLPRRQPHCCSDHWDEPRLFHLLSPLAAC